MLLDSGDRKGTANLLQYYIKKYLSCDGYFEKQIKIKSSTRVNMFMSFAPKPSFLFVKIFLVSALIQFLFENIMSYVAIYNDATYSSGRMPMFDFHHFLLQTSLINAESEGLQSCPAVTPQSQKSISFFSLETTLGVERRD